MKTIKFSEDYEKLPENWHITTGTLIAIYREKVEIIKNKYTEFWRNDTKYRGKIGYYNLNFEDAIILIFIHHNSGKLIPTIRRNTEEKFKYYLASIGETFLFARSE